MLIATALAPRGHDSQRVSLKEVFLNRQFSYLFSIRVGALCHFSGLAILTMTWLFPSLFRDEALKSLSWGRMYALPALSGAQKVDDLAQGMLGLLQWDGFVGGMSALVWAMWKLADARREKVR